MRRASASTGRKTRALGRHRDRDLHRRRTSRARSASALQPPSRHDPSSSHAAHSLQASDHQRGASERHHAAALAKTVPSLRLLARRASAAARFPRWLNAMTPPGGEAAQPPGSQVDTPVVSRQPRSLAEVGHSLRHPFSLGFEAVCTNPAARHADRTHRRLTALPAPARNDRWPSLPDATTHLVAIARRLQQKAICHLAPLLCLCPGCLTARVKLRGPERKRGSRQLQRGVRHAACLCINRKKDTRPPHAIETAFPTVDGDMASAICPPTSQPKRRIGLACGACPPGARPPARRPRARSRSQLEKTLASARALATRVPANSPRFRPNRPPLRSQAAKPLSRRARRWSPPWSREDLADSRTSPTACDTLSVLASRRSAPTQQLATLAACVGDLQRCQNTSKTTGGRRSKMRQTCWSRTRAAFNRKPSAISSR